jgi:altronate dehydratase large subunit
VRTLAGSGINPNIAAVLVVGLGCEKIIAAELAAAIRVSGKPAEYINIQEAGGTEKTVRRGREMVRGLLAHAGRCQRQPVDYSRLIVGVNCGGSDTSSGIAANPAVGEAADRIVDAGGTVVLAEVSEFIGAEHILAQRAQTTQVKDDILRIVACCEQELLAAKVDIRGSQPSPGNIAGGLSSIEEKSLGAIHKSGSRPISQVLRYAERPTARGVVIMDGPAQDVISNTGLTASGSQIILFTTGLGTPVGSPVAPVVKITGNGTTYTNLRANIDLSAHRVLAGRETLAAAGQRIFAYTVEVLNGKRTKAEKLGYQEFDTWRIGPTS